MKIFPAAMCNCCECSLIFEQLWRHKFEATDKQENGSLALLGTAVCFAGTDTIWKKRLWWPFSCLSMVAAQILPTLQQCESLQPQGHSDTLVFCFKEAEIELWRSPRGLNHVNQESRHLGLWILLCQC